MNHDSRGATDHLMMRRAVRLALRGIGRVEPNPPVGCVIVDSTTGAVLTEGWHTHFGGPHAEAHALTRADEHDLNLQGATAYVTLEPCSHTGKTPPCADALIKAGISRVVMARRDPSPVSAGGIDKLETAGIPVAFCDTPEAIHLSDPFTKVITTGLPWVIMKWAQSRDGFIATHTGDSKWISNERSRAAVHRLRSRVDAVLTGIGTVRMDDPMLTARTCRNPRRIARRIVIDPALSVSPNAQLVQTAFDVPTTIIHGTDLASRQRDRMRELEAEGVELVPFDPHHETALGNARFDMREVLAELRARYDLTNVLVEAGNGLMTPFLKDDHHLVDEALVYIAPRDLDDPNGMRPIGNTDQPINELQSVLGFTLFRERCIGNDVELLLRRQNKTQVESSASSS